MTKLKFLMSLHEKLSDLPQADVEERLNFYSEMIEDRMEEGLSEEEAVAAIGSVDEISQQIRAQFPPRPAAQVPAPKTSKKGLRITLLILGSPIWASLLITVFALAISLHAVLWSLVAALWSLFVAAICCALASFIASGTGILSGSAPMSLALLGFALICAGLGVFLFMGAWAFGKANARLAQLTVRGIRKVFS